MGHTLRHAGSMTSTATCRPPSTSCATASRRSAIPLHILGVIGPILCIYFMTRHIRPKFPPKAQRFHMAEVTLGDSCAGRTLDDLSKDLPSGVQTTMVRKGQEHHSVGRYRSGIRRWSPDHRGTGGGNRRSGCAPGKVGTGPYRQGSFRPRLHPGFRGESQRGRCRSRSFRCRPAFPFISCMSGAMTWTSSRRLILRWSSAIGSGC